MFHFHKWSKWSVYHQSMLSYPGPLAQARPPTQFVEDRQKRVCSICRKTQDIPVCNDLG